MGRAMSAIRKRGGIGHRARMHCDDRRIGMDTVQFTAGSLSWRDRDVGIFQIATTRFVLGMDCDLESIVH